MVGRVKIQLRQDHRVGSALPIAPRLLIGGWLAASINGKEMNNNVMG